MTKPRWLKQVILWKTYRLLSTIMNATIDNSIIAIRSLIFFLCFFLQLLLIDNKLFINDASKMDRNCDIGTWKITDSKCHYSIIMTFTVSHFPSISQFVSIFEVLWLGPLIKIIKSYIDWSMLLIFGCSRRSRDNVVLKH